MNVIIAGAGEVGRHAAEVLSSSAHSVTVIELSESKLRALEESVDTGTVLGNCTHLDVLRHAGVEKCDLLVAATQVDEINMLCAFIAKNAGAAKTIARIHHTAFFSLRDTDFARELGIDLMICPEYATSLEIARILRNPGVIAIEDFGLGRISMQRFEVDGHSSAIGQTLKQLSLPNGVRLAMMERGERAWIPQGESVIEKGDVITLIGEPTPFETARKTFRKGRPKHLSIAVMGGTAMGVWLCRAMKSKVFSVRLFERNIVRAEDLAAKLEHVTVMTSDPTNPDVFREEQLDEVDAFVAVDKEDERNILGCAQAKTLGAPRCISVLHKPTYMHLLSHVGIDQAFSPRTVAVRAILAQIDDQRVHHVTSIADGVADLYEVNVSKKSSVAGQTLKNIVMPKNSLVGAVRRGDEVRVPGAMDEICAGDRVLVIGSHNLQRELGDLFGAKTVNFTLIRRQLGLLMLVLSGIIVAVGLYSATAWLLGRESERDALAALMITGFVGAVLGAGMYLVGRGKGKEIGRREAILLVGTSWFVAAAVCAAPFRLWAELSAEPAAAAHPFENYVDCYFEAMSGLTTTGATILPRIATLPRSLLLWRALTHWLGGLGIVVLFVAVLPILGVGGRRLFKTESAGPSPEGVRPRIREAAQVLWFIYVGLTVVEVIVLRIVGMSWFDAVCHAPATIATGGFSTYDDSAAHFGTSIHIVIMIFMLLAGVNFGLYYQIIRGGWRRALGDVELRAYLCIIVVASAVIVAHGWQAVEPGRVVVDSMFQVISIQTTTGFATADFDTWSFVAKFSLLGLMFVGGCAGSTGGGIKVIRIVIAFKAIATEIEHVFRPNVVRTIKIGDAPVDAELKLQTMIYLVSVLVIFAMGSAALMITDASNGIDITTAATASAATLNNIGPGLARVGATQNYSWFSDAGKLVMSLLMAAGRLEVFTIVVLFTPRFWRSV